MLRYFVTVNHMYDHIPIAYASFKTINQLVRYCVTFEENQVIFDAKDELFDKSIDMDELIKIWRSC